MRGPVSSSALTERGSEWYPLPTCLEYQGWDPWMQKREVTKGSAWESAGEGKGK